MTCLKLVTRKKSILWHMAVTAALSGSWGAQQQARAAIADGLTAYYAFDDGSGTTLSEATGKSADGELFNFEEDNSQWVTGKVGKALSYDGIDDYVIAPEFELATDSLSVSAWVRANELGNWSSILKNWGGGRVGQFHFGLGPGTAGTLNVFITEADGNAFNAGTEAEPLPTEEWQHVAFIANAATGDVTLYRNGEAVDTQPYDGTFTAEPNSTALGIGVKTTDDGTQADPGNGCCAGYWNGELDEIAMWNRALSEAELTQVYQLGLAGNPIISGNTVLGDFNQDGQLTDVDINQLTDAVRSATNPKAFDVTGDNLVNEADRIEWVEKLKKTYFGDANLDGEFNTTDFVSVFQTGEYEDAIAMNSLWQDGDWNGDGDFNSTDFVTGFQSGGFEAGPRAAVSAVPEPSSIGLLVASGLLMAAGKRRSRRAAE